MEKDAYEIATVSKSRDAINQAKHKLSWSNHFGTMFMEADLLKQ